MCASGVELFRYPSARDPRGGSNVAAFTPFVFGKAKPRDIETWHVTATPALVELTKRDYFGAASHTFERAQFLVDGALPAPAP